MKKAAEKIWMDGKLVPWDEARVHVLTHSLHYGLAAFEGIRAYRTTDGRTAIFRLREHLQRLYDSAHIAMMEIPFPIEKLAEACQEVLRANKFEEGYLRPIAFFGEGSMGVGSVNPVRTCVATWPWGAYLGEEGLKKGIRAKISSFTRMHVNISMVRGKITGQYVNSVLAKREAVLAGFDEAILLDAQGYVSEASGENVFIVNEGVVQTPPLSSPVLAGITRDTVLKMARDLGMTVTERKFTRDTMYISDEVFFTGTAAEITPVREVDNRKIGTGGPGPVTKRLQDAFFKTVRGEDPRYREWLSYL
jgi:branched-chain amino acid aminotransferase